MTSDVNDAIRLAELGWPVFPGMLTKHKPPKKVPIGDLVEHGFKDATLNPKKIAMWWRVRPDAYIGVSMPPNTVALDVDEVEVFERIGLELKDGPGQKTPRGGYHRFFRTDGRFVRQSVKTDFPGADTRVGGKGYVFAWEPNLFPSVDELPMAPEWIYAGKDEQETAQRPMPSADVKVFKMGSRDNEATSFAGSMRRAGAGPAAIAAALRAMRSAGQIEQTREDPFTDRDIDRIAGSIGVRGSEAVEKSRRKDPERHYAVDLLKKDLPPLEYLVAEILPEGLGVVAGAPKVGKSWLTFQAALELCVGGSLLGRPVDEPRPVLYYGLEDGERRFQKRLMDLIGGRSLDIGLLELRYEAPAITEGLEEDIRFWLDQNPQGAVFIDVLAKVRPVSKGKGNAYDEDYTVIGPLQTISKERPGSAIVVVTHDRKAGSEDFLTTVTGTRGITGAADWVWVLKRDRLAIKGTIFVTGRDIERDSAIEANFTGNWTALPSHSHAKSFDQDLVLNALRTAPDGEATAQEIALSLNPDYVPAADAKVDPERQSASDKLNSLVDQGLARKVGRRAGRNGALVFHYISDSERKEIIDQLKAESHAVMPSNGALTVIRSRKLDEGVTVVTPRGRANHAPEAPEGLDGVTPELDGVTAWTDGVTHGVTRDPETQIRRRPARALAQEVPFGNPRAPSRTRDLQSRHNRHTVVSSADGVTVVESSDVSRARARGRAPAHTRPSHARESWDQE